MARRWIVVQRLHAHNNFLWMQNVIGIEELNEFAARLDQSQISRRRHASVRLSQESNLKRRVPIVLSLKFADNRSDVFHRAVVGDQYFDWPIRLSANRVQRFGYQ